MLKTILGVLSILVGVVLGLYVGGYMLFVGGIVQIINAITVVPVLAYPIAVGILKVVLASTIGGLITWVFSFIGTIILKD